MTIAARPPAEVIDLDPVKRGFTVRGWLLIVMVAMLVNLPIVHGTWTQWRVARSGTDVTARVTDTVELPPAHSPEYVVAFAFPQQVDTLQRRWTARVDRAAYERAVDQRTIRVRVLEGRPAAYRAEGQVTSHLGLVITLLADLGLLLMVLFAARHRGRFRPPLRLVARTSTWCAARSPRSTRTTSSWTSATTTSRSCSTATPTRSATSSRPRCAAG